MKKHLHVKMINKPHAFPEEPSADFEAWGRILFLYQSEDTVKLLIDTEWDLLVFCEWFISNKHSLLHETLSAPNNQKLNERESVAEAILRFNQKEFPENEEEAEFEWFDYLFQFSSRHNLWNSLMGNRIPNIMLSCNYNDGEISFCSDKEKWRYEFNMNDFVEEVEQEIEKFLLYSKKHRGTKDSLARIDLILLELGKAKEVG